MDGCNLLYVCKIDKDIFHCVTSEISSDTVVITEKQMLHILSSHPENEHRWILKELSEVVKFPDYILQDTHEAHIHDTAIVMKRIERKGGGYRVIVRLATSNDESGKQNSIITAFYISEKKWNKYLRNKVILYKRL